MDLVSSILINIDIFIALRRGEVFYNSLAHSQVNFIAVAAVDFIRSAIYTLPRRLQDVADSVRDTVETAEKQCRTCGEKVPRDPRTSNFSALTATMVFDFVTDIPLPPFSL